MYVPHIWNAVDGLDGPESMVDAWGCAAGPQEEEAPKDETGMRMHKEKEGSEAERLPTAINILGEIIKPHASSLTPVYATQQQQLSEVYGGVSFEELQALSLAADPVKHYLDKKGQALEVFAHGSGTHIHTRI